MPGIGVIALTAGESLVMARLPGDFLRNEAFPHLDRRVGDLLPGAPQDEALQIGQAVLGDDEGAAQLDFLRSVW